MSCCLDINIFVGTPKFFKVALWVAMETMIFHITKMHLSLRTIFILHISGPIEPINIHKKMFSVFNVGLITGMLVHPMSFLSLLNFH